MKTKNIILDDLLDKYEADREEYKTLNDFVSVEIAANYRTE